jgi:ribosome-associated protein
MDQTFLTIRPLDKLVYQFLDSHKAQDILKIDLRGKAVFADAMIIASGTSALFLRALAEKLRDFLQKLGIQRVHIEGLEAGDWVLVDGQDVIVHLFRPDVRERYALEKMWSVDCQQEPLKQVG